MNKEMTPWKVFMDSDMMMLLSYTSDALGGEYGELIHMMMSAKSANEFVSKYRSAPIYEDPDHPENKDTYPFPEIIDACMRIEKEEAQAMYALTGIPGDAAQHTELLSKLRNKSVERMIRFLENR